MIDVSPDPKPERMVWLQVGVSLVAVMVVEDLQAVVALLEA